MPQIRARFPASALLDASPGAAGLPDDPLELTELWASQLAEMDRVEEVGAQSGPVRVGQLPSWATRLVVADRLVGDCWSNPFAPTEL